MTDKDKKLQNIMYKGDITSTTKTDSYGNTYTEHTVPNGTNTPIKYATYSTDSYVLFGKGVGDGTMGGEGRYTCISKDGLLQANNAIIYGKIYATDGEFSGSIKCGKKDDDGIVQFQVDKNGNMCSRSGEIGGWTINRSNIFTGSKTIGDFLYDDALRYIQLESASSSDFGIRVGYTYGTRPSDLYWIKHNKYVKLKDNGEIECCHKQYERSGDSANGNLLDSLQLILNGEGISFKKESKTKFELSQNRLDINVSIYYKGELLDDLLKNIDTN